MNKTTSNARLPELSDESIARIEEDVFDAIGTGNRPSDESRPLTLSPSTRARARRRRWLTGLGVAAAFAVGVMVAAPIVSGLSPSGSTGAGSAVSADQASTEAAPMTDARLMEEMSEFTQGFAPDANLDVSTQAAPESSASADREVITTASATVQVADIPDAIAAITTIAEGHGGYVESTDVSRTADELSQGVDADAGSLPVPVEGAGWISIRVPSADVNTVIAELDTTGEVLASSLSRSDVTDQAIDLRARVEATRASVARLTELMGQSGSLNDLIQAEVALSDRQAQLESYEQQLALLEDQVAMSSLSVSLTTAPPAAEPDPSGFGSGLVSGWNGLIASLNALVLVAGFLLPWLGVAAVIVTLIWIIRQARRRQKGSAEDAEA